MTRTERIVRFLDKVSEWSLYAIIFALPFSKSIVEISATVAIISFIVKKIILRKSPFRKDLISIALYLFVASALISLVNSQYIGLSIRAFFSKTLEYALIFLIAREIINTKEKLYNFMTIAFISCIVIVIDAFAQYYITHRDFLHNYPPFHFTMHHPEPSVMTLSFPYDLGIPTASFPYPNDFSAWILMFIFPMVSVGIFSGKHWIKRIRFILVGSFLAFLLYLTKVRGAWVSFVAASGIMVMIKLKKVVVLLLVLAVAAILVMEKSTLQYISSTTSLKDRSEMWDNGWKIFKKHPIVGNGLNTFFAEYKKIRSDKSKNIRGSYAHNCYLQMASDVGLLGLGSFLLFIGGILTKGFTALRRIKDKALKALILGLNLGLTAFLIHSFVDTNLYSLNLAVLFWMTAGVMLASIKIAEKNA